MSDERAKQAARDICGLWADQGRPGVPELTPTNVAEIISRYYPEPSAQEGK